MFNRLPPERQDHYCINCQRAREYLLQGAITVLAIIDSIPRVCATLPDIPQLLLAVADEFADAELERCILRE